MQPEVPGNQSDSNPPKRNPKNVFLLGVDYPNFRNPEQPLGLSFWLQGYQKTTLRKQAALFEQMPFTVAHLLILHREPYQMIMITMIIKASIQQDIPTHHIYGTEPTTTSRSISRNVIGQPRPINPELLSKLVSSPPRKPFTVSLSLSLFLHPLTHSLIHHHSSSTICHSFGLLGGGFLLLTNVSCGFGHLSSCWGDFAIIDEKVYETVI